MTRGLHQRKVNGEELDEIVERLHTTSTKSSGKPCRLPVPAMKNVIAGAPLPVGEQLEICQRLYSTPTKASSGGKRCKSAVPLTTPGLGLKMLPVIEGLEGRFKGAGRPKSHSGTTVGGRLHSTQTATARSRQDYPRILLWPERTLVSGNLERLRAYQDTGMLSKQAGLPRRDKWFLWKQGLIPAGCTVQYLDDGMCLCGKL